MSFNGQHFAKYSVVHSNVLVKLDLTVFEGKFEEAQEWLGWRVLQDCQAKMPRRTGNLQQRSHVEDGGRKVVFPGPTSRFLYGGLVMVDPVTRSPWARRGVKKVVTDRKLTYSDPAARAKWFEEAKAENRDAWIAGVNDRVKGR